MQVPHDVPAQLVRRLAHLGPEPAVVHDGVVALAEQGGVVDVRAATIGPVPHVMRPSPARRCGAPGVGAAPVPAPQPAPLRPGEQPDHPPQVQVLPGGAEHVRHQRRVARDPAQHLRRQQHPGRGRPRAPPRPGPLPPGRSTRCVTCSAAADPAAPSPPCSSASRPDERRHTSVNASTRRCPAGRRSRSPVSSLGAGADNGPIAASSTAACSGVITSWYSVTSAGLHQRLRQPRHRARACSCRSSSSPWHAVPGQHRRAQPAHLVRTPRRAQLQQRLRHRRHGLRVQRRPQPGHLPQRRQRQPRRHAGRLHPRPHHTQRRLRGRAPTAASGASAATCPTAPRRPPPPTAPPGRPRPGATTARTPAPTRARSTPTGPPHPDAPPPPPPRHAPRPPAAATASTSVINSASSASDALDQHLTQARPTPSGQPPIRERRSTRPNPPLSIPHHTRTHVRAPVVHRADSGPPQRHRPRPRPPTFDADPRPTNSHGHSLARRRHPETGWGTPPPTPDPQEPR